MAVEHLLQYRNEELAEKNQLSTAEVIALLNSFYLNVYHKKTDTLDLAVVGEIWNKYPITLYGGRLEDKRTVDDITRAMKYALRRIPIEVYSNLNTSICLSDNWDDFIKKRAKPHSRSRWYRVDGEDESVAVTMQVRSKTDHHEILSLLAVMENARNYYCKGSTTEEDRASIYKEFMLLCNEQGLAEEEADALFNNYINGKRHLVRGENPYSLNGLYKDKGRKAAKAALTLAAAKLEELGGSLSNIDTIFFSNDFILRNMLSLNILEAKIEGDNIELGKYLTTKIASGDPEYAEISEIIRKYLVYSDTLEDKLELRDLAIRFALVQFVSKYSGADPVIIEFKKRLTNTDYLEAMGFHTLVDKEESPITDPIRYIDFGALTDDSVLFTYPVIGNLFRVLKQAGLRTIMTPYALGDLSFGLGFELLRINPDAKLMEVGKVGCFEQCEKGTLSRGHIVAPMRSINATTVAGGLRRSLRNQASQKDAEGICPIRQHEAMVTTRAVVAQTFDDARQKIFIGDNQITIDMEGTAFADLLAVFPTLITIFVNYISDFSREDGSEAISEPLGANGWLAVLFSTIIALRSRCRLSGLSC